MSGPSVPIQLVSAPSSKRRCRFCKGELTAIELWHDCPQRRLEFGLYRLAQGRRAAAST
jgi:hypothetical protein